MYCIDLNEFEGDEDGDGITDFNHGKSGQKEPKLIFSYPKTDVGKGDILDFHVRSEDKQDRNAKIHVQKRVIAFMLHEASGYYPRKVKFIPKYLQGFDASVEKWIGDEEYGDPEND
jgi:hypothetical protein